MSIFAIAARGAPDDGFKFRIITSAGIIFTGTVANWNSEWVVFERCTVANIHNGMAYDAKEVVVGREHAIAAWRFDPQ